MKTKQINLKIPEDFLLMAQNYARQNGFRNIQELATQCMREKILDRNEFDETFTEKEIDLIDELIVKIIKGKDFGTEEELNKILLE